MEKVNCFDLEREVLWGRRIRGLTFTLMIKCITFIARVGSNLFTGSGEQSLAFPAVVCRFNASMPSSVNRLDFQMICLLFSNLCMRGETLKMPNIRMFCLDAPRCFFTLEHSTKQSLNLWVEVLPDRPYFRQILCFQNPVAANGCCLWLSAEKVANCRNLCFDGFKHFKLVFSICGYLA